MSTTYRLTYFDMAGRAEPIRIALHMAGVDFEDVRVDYATFKQLKADGAFPLGSVPVLEIDGEPLCQSTAILRYVAGLMGDDRLYPSDPMLRLVVDSAMDTFNDTMSRGLAPSFSERDPEKKMALRKVFVEDGLVKGCSYVERLIEVYGGPFLTGEDLTIGDLLIGRSVGHYLSGGLDGVTREVLAPYPRLLVLARAFANHPDVKAYYASREA